MIQWQSPLFQSWGRMCVDPSNRRCSDSSFILAHRTQALGLPASSRYIRICCNRVGCLCIGACAAARWGAGPSNSFNAFISLRFGIRGEAEFIRRMTQGVGIFLSDSH